MKEGDRVGVAVEHTVFPVWGHATAFQGIEAGI